MVIRPYWISRITKAWNTRSIVWLSGVRRVGKTTIAKMIEGCRYLNCDLPSVQRQLEDPESYFHFLEEQCIVFDEIHRLNNPALTLKIAADEFPNLKILATGSSTLSATKKFRDSLTGRKVTIYLPPVLWTETIEQFGIHDLDRRLLHGGLPEQLQSENTDHAFYAEWIDSFYARDIQELFGIRNRHGFLKLMKILFMQSGGTLDYSRLSKQSELSRPTVILHIEALQTAHAVYLVIPYHGGGKREIVKMPKVYAFDTGMASFIRGWNDIRQEDRGLLWEHLVLDALRSHYNYYQIHYWRDKSGREIDFVISPGKNKTIACECKINPDNFDPGSLKKFREHHPNGENYCICPVIEHAYRKKYDSLIVEFISIRHLLNL